MYAFRPARLGLWLSLGALVLGVPACVGPRSEVEVYHLRDLIKEGRTEHVEELTKALGSPYEEVRKAAIEALSELGDVAEPRLRAIIEEESTRSGPAMLALGRGANPENLGFIREFQSQPNLSGPAKEAERAIEKRLYERARSGDVEAAEAYLDDPEFGKSSKADEIRRLRRIQVARATFDRLSATPDVAGWRAYIQEFGDMEDAALAKARLAQLLVQEARWHLERAEYTQAREKASQVVDADPRRDPEAKRLTAETWLAEGRSLKAGNKDTDALRALELASAWPEFRAETERLRADILVSQGRARLEANDIPAGLILLEDAARMDPARRPEVAALKSDLSSELQSRILSTDPGVRSSGLVGLVSLGDEAIRPMEVYLGNLFVRKDYALVEEVVVALKVARTAGAAKASKSSSASPSDRIAELLSEYLRSALASSSSELTRFFASPEFTTVWTPLLNPLDPRHYPTVYKVEELGAKHLGLTRIGISVQALLGEGVVEVVKGSLLREEEVLRQLNAGQIGQDSALPLLTRVQLAGKYAALMAALRRSAEKQPSLLMEYAVGFSLPPVQPADWLQVAEGFDRVIKKVAEGARLTPVVLADAFRASPVQLAKLEVDARALTLHVADPVTLGLTTGTPEARTAALNRTFAILAHSARVAFALYSSIDRFTVILGTAEQSADGLGVVKGGRFDPETRLVLSQKSLPRLEYARLRSQAGAYTPAELSLVDVVWSRWELKPTGR